jgi:Cu/Ag efflux protein CusF
MSSMITQLLRAARALRIATVLMAATAAAAQTPLPAVDAEVRRVDTATGRVTLRHGDIPNLSMPGMTMVFSVRDRRWLDGLRVGDQVRVTIDRAGNGYEVQSLEPLPR